MSTVTRPEISAADRRRVNFASTIGTTVEFYDFYAYATASVAVFPYLFFAKTSDQTMALLQSFATFGLAFVARPLGSIVFGHFGDKVGRKATLVGALLTMGIATVIIGCLPTYDQIGIWAPALLALMRFCQGLGLGGEWSGAALLSSEYSTPGNRAQAAMWPQLGAPFGFFLSNGLFLILVAFLGYNLGDTTGSFMVWGWRVPFLLSAVMVIIGLYVRVRLEETPVFQETLDNNEQVDAPLGEVFRTSWRALIQGTFVMVGTYTLFYLVTMWILSFGIAESGLHFPYLNFLEIQLLTIFGFMAGIPIAARLADNWGRRPTLGWTTVAIIVFGFTFKMFLNPATATKTSIGLFLVIGMFLMGMIFGPMSAALPELFPTNVRYTGSGIAYNVSSILGAAVAPFIATALAAKHGVQSVGWYLVIVSVISLLAILTMAEHKDDDMSQL